jgi:hypothetical protein
MMQRETIGTLLYCWWNIWKERNTRVFESIQKSAYQVALRAKEEVDLYRLAFRGEVLDQGPDQVLQQQQLNS